MRLCCIGISHRTAEVQIRERFAVSSDAMPGLLEALHGDDALAEVFVVSTCNRFEAYAVPPQGLDADAAHVALRRRLAESARCTEDAIDRVAYHHFGQDAARHLFRVASSLDSMVLGEAQVLGQLKAAWQLAQQVGTVGSLLDRVVTRAFRVAKRVRTETSLGAGGVSIAFVAAQLARRIFDDLGACRVLLVGAGEMAELAAVHLSEQGARAFTVANRTLERAQRVAAPRGWAAAALQDIEGLLRGADIVITSTGSAVPIIDRAHVKRAIRRRDYSPLFIIDIAVPRDVDRRVGDMDGVYLYNIDDLEAVAARNRQRREAEAATAEEIVREEVAKFADWLAAQSVSPVIAALRHHLFEVRDIEQARSERVLAALTPEQRQAVDRMTAAIVGRFAARPIERLKSASGPRDREALAWAARELFGLADLAVLEGDRAADAESDASEPPAPAMERRSR